MKLATLALAFFLLTPCVSSQAKLNPACDPDRQAKKDLESFYRSTEVRFTDRLTDKAAVAALASKYPDALAVNQLQQDWTKTQNDDEREAMLRHYEQLAREHPASPQQQYLYALALYGIDTPKSIELLKTSLARYPDYPWPRLGLARSYSFGKFQDKPQMQAELDAFFTACPNSLDTSAWRWQLQIATPAVALLRAPRLRNILPAEIDPDQFLMWRTLWDLEFKGAPADQHAKVRAQLREDLARLEKTPPVSSPSWLLFLKEGFTMLDDQPAIQRINVELEKSFPSSIPAKRVDDERWWKAHPAPLEDAPEETKQAAYREELPFYEEQLKKWPDDVLLQWERFDLVAKLPDSSPEHIGKAADDLLSKIYDPDWSFSRLQVAQLFVQRGMRLTEVPSLVEKANDGNRSSWMPDTYSEELRARIRRSDNFTQIEGAKVLVDAAKQLSQPKIASLAIQKLGELLPVEPENQSAFWTAKAKFAELTGHGMDALVLYRAAIDARPADYKAGKQDELTEAEARVWKELSGSEESRALFTTRSTRSATEGTWKAPKKDLPAWELSDLEGKKWTATSFRGKTVLINIWSTSCLPCREEHVYLQRLYEKVKDRPDIQILTFNIDPEVGAVAPYMKKAGYTFPVLLAKDYVEEVVPEVSIPRNWIVNSEGKWLLEEADFNAGEWPDRVLQKVEAAKTGECPTQ